MLVGQHSGAGSGKILSSRPTWGKWQDPVCRNRNKRNQTVLPLLEKPQVGSVLLKHIKTKADSMNVEGNAR